MTWAKEALLCDDRIDNYDPYVIEWLENYKRKLFSLNEVIDYVTPLTKNHEFITPLHITYILRKSCEKITRLKSNGVEHQMWAQREYTEKYKKMTPRELLVKWQQDKLECEAGIEKEVLE